MDLPNINTDVQAAINFIVNTVEEKLKDYGAPLSVLAQVVIEHTYQPPSQARFPGNINAYHTKLTSPLSVLSETLTERIDPRTTKDIGFVRSISVTVDTNNGSFTFPFKCEVDGVLYVNPFVKDPNAPISDRVDESVDLGTIFDTYANTFKTVLTPALSDGSIEVPRDIYVKVNVFRGDVLGMYPAIRLLDDIDKLSLSFLKDVSYTHLEIFFQHTAEPRAEQILLSRKLESGCTTVNLHAAEDAVSVVKEWYKLAQHKRAIERSDFIYTFKKDAH